MRMRMRMRMKEEGVRCCVWQRRRKVWRLKADGLVSQGGWFAQVASGASGTHPHGKERRTH